MSVLFVVLFLGTKSYPLLDLGVGCKLILVNNYGLIIQEKSLFRYFMCVVWPFVI